MHRTLLVMWLLLLLLATVEGGGRCQGREGVGGMTQAHGMGHG
jgi:hypothetical protein